MTTQAAVPDSEYAARTQAVRDALVDGEMDVLLAYGAHRDYHPADLRYLARWYCVEEETACMVIPAQGPTTLVTDAGWDLERAEAEAYADRMRLADDLGAGLAELVREAGGEKARVGITGYSIFPAPAYLALTGELPQATVTDASELTSDLRMIKSPSEIRLLREASHISDSAMKAGIEAIRAGAAEFEVAAAAEAVIRQSGAEPSFVTEMGAGPRTAYGTFLPGTRRLERGEIAILDCGARVHGYHGDMCRTVVVEGPSDDQRAMLEAVEAAVDQAIAAMRPGETVGAVRDVAANAIHDAGFGEYWWDAFMPHGNGAGQHEPPNAKQHPELPLREGMVLCVEPGITVPGQGAVIIEQMVAIGPDGAEVLNQLPTNMWER